MYFELATGRIVPESKIELAYEVCNGEKADDNPVPYRRWSAQLPIKRIPESKITVKQLIKGDAFVDACMLYRNQHKCTLAEAREVCEQIRKEMGA